MNTLRVIKRPLRYATRRLLPGDMFQANKPSDERILLATKRVEVARAEVTLPPPPPSLLAQLDHDGNGHPGGSKAPEQTDDLKALREEYEAKMGKRPFYGWDAATLREKMNG